MVYCLCACCSCDWCALCREVPAEVVGICMFESCMNMHKDRHAREYVHRFFQEVISEVMFKMTILFFLRVFDYCVLCRQQRYSLIAVYINYQVSVSTHIVKSS